MDTERPRDQEARIREYRQAIDAAIRTGNTEIVDTYEQQLREDLLEDTPLSDQDRYAEEAIYWHRTRDLFDHEELTDAFPDSADQTRCLYEIGDQLIEDGTITSVRNGADGSKTPYHLLSADDVLEYAEGQDHELDRDHIEDELAELRARLPVSQIERRYPGLQDDSV